MEIFKRSWKNVPSSIRKPLVLFIGLIIILLGIALLPLPGPGWAVIFIGFAILATEFEIAEKIRFKMVSIIKQIIIKFRYFYRRKHLKH